MPRKSYFLLLVLAALWGASYLFIEVGLRDFSPAMIVFLRTLLAALVVLPFALRADALRGMRSLAVPVVILALVQVAAPFMLISVGQESITSSLTGILVASAPIFTALLAARFAAREERLGRVGLLGVAMGIAGVALLLGVETGGALVGGLMVVLASFGYAVGAIFLKRRLNEPQPIGMVAATMAVSAVMVAPVAAVDPGSAPGLGPIAAILALGAGGTGIAFVIYHTLIAWHGATRASLVAYIAPIFAVFYGVVLLDEPITVSTFAGLALILLGSWIAAEARSPAPPAESHVPGQPDQGAAALDRARVVITAEEAA